MIKNITQEAILAFEKNYRTNFVNSLSGYKSLSLIGTQNKAGQQNLAIFNSVFHVGANPPLIGFVARPSENYERHTIENILETGFYTINHVGLDFYEKAHQTAARYDRNSSEFDAVGLKNETLNDFKAPFVSESAIKIAVKFKEKIDIKSNGTSIIIGEIVEVYIKESVIAEDGFVNLSHANGIAGGGLDAYYKTELLARFSYAKVGKGLDKIN